MSPNCLRWARFLLLALPLAVHQSELQAQRPAEANTQPRRVFTVLIDDMNTESPDRSWIVAPLEFIGNSVLHKGDVVGVFSTGASSIAADLEVLQEPQNFDQITKRVLNAPLSRIATVPAAGARYNDRVALQTLTDVLLRAIRLNVLPRTLFYVSATGCGPFLPDRVARAATLLQKEPIEPPARRAQLNPTEDDIVTDIAAALLTARRSTTSIYVLNQQCFLKL